MASSIVFPVYFLILSLLVGSPLFRVAHDFCSPGCYHRAATYSSTFLPSLKDGVKGELTAKPTGVLPRDGSARAGKGDVPVLEGGKMVLFKRPLFLGCLGEVCL